jgi:hypothetical protein
MAKAWDIKAQPANVLTERLTTASSPQSPKAGYTLPSLSMGPTATSSVVGDTGSVAEALVEMMKTPSVYARHHLLCDPTNERLIV